MTNRKMSKMISPTRKTIPAIEPTITDTLTCIGHSCSSETRTKTSL